MPTITDHIQGAVFEPQIISLMGSAYERALKSFPGTASQHIREAIAGHIIFMVRAGERNPDKLCEESLAVLGPR